MKIGLLRPEPVPPTIGGAERLVEGLETAIRSWTSHAVEVVHLPLHEHTAVDLLGSYRAWANLDASGFDLVISTKYPTWMVRHPRHVIYLLHPLRGLYDTYHLFGLPESVDLGLLPVGLTRILEQRPEYDRVDDVIELALDALGQAEPSSALHQFPGPLIRSITHYLDAAAMDPARIERYAAISRTVAERRSYFPPGVPIEVVYPPSSLTPDDVETSAAKHFLAVSRLDGPKRVDLLVNAFRKADTELPLVIAGVGPEEASLRDLAAGDTRVEMRGYVPDRVLIELYRDAVAIPFVPLDEDFGLITVEAASFGKPVITCSDSGGPAELVLPGRTGVVVAPVAEALAEAITALAASPRTAARMGQSARRNVATITWEHAVARLLPAVGPTAGALMSPKTLGRASRRLPSRRRSVTVLSTFPIHPRRGGGQLRSYHLYGGLGREFDVEIVSLGSPDAHAVVELAPGVCESVVGKSSAHTEAEQEAAVGAGVPVDDIVSARLAHLTPEFGKAAYAALARSSCVILAHPFLYSVARAGKAQPLIYDAHNAESGLKASLLPPSADRLQLLAEVRAAEGGACNDASVVCTCSTADGRTLVDEYKFDDRKLLSIPNGSDVQTLRFVTGTRRRTQRDAWLRAYADLTKSHHSFDHLALFIGSWHVPNNEAGIQILDFAATLPDVLFVLAGSHCLALVAEPRPVNVVLLGIIDEATRARLLGAADVALNPMLRGSGSNLKIGDYFAAGVPVVSTPTGIRGMAAAADRHLLVEEIDNVPAAVRRMLADPVLADECAVQARKLMEEQYDWRRLSIRLGDQISSLLGAEQKLCPPAEFVVPTARTGITETAPPIVD